MQGDRRDQGEGAPARDADHDRSGSSRQTSARRTSGSAFDATDHVDRVEPEDFRALLIAATARILVRRHAETRAPRPRHRKSCVVNIPSCRPAPPAAVTCHGRQDGASSRAGGAPAGPARRGGLRATGDERRALTHVGEAPTPGSRRDETAGIYSPRNLTRSRASPRSVIAHPLARQVHEGRGCRRRSRPAAVHDESSRALDEIPRR